MVDKTRLHPQTRELAISIPLTGSLGKHITNQPMAKSNEPI